ncbi:unnamed protein product [Parnassius mnemosyne]|uniref:Uncharacterized protein n=1 Tax=Parnassius mnemosyne TaxID=213953 RepID=A0AAV1KAI0_9NEOP
MSEEEKKSGSATGGPSVVMVEQTSESRHKQPYRPTELQEETPELHHKRSRAPAVPSVAEELKEISEDSNVSNNAEIKERKESERAMSSDKQKQMLAKKLSSNTKKRDISPETITLAPIEVETKLETITVPPQPLPSQEPVKESRIASDKEADKEEEDSIKDEIAELRTPEVSKKHSEWSDEEEAGGLPRSESRSSRISRTVRQLFCCGVPYEAASEDDVSTHRYAGI